MGQLRILIKNNNQRGQLLVEILLAIALTAIMLPALLTGLFSSNQGKAQQGQRMQAVSLLKEAEEVVRNVKDSDWSDFAVNGTFHPTVSGTVWALSSGSESVFGMTRTITISDVQRNVAGAIVTTGGTVDPSTKKVVTQVTWGDPYPSSVDSTIYVTRYSQNETMVHTTVADFTAGVNSGTTIINTQGGEVVLGAGGSGDWCDPNLTISAVDLPKSGVANSISAIEGNVFTGTGDNSSGISYATVNISNSDPPTGALEATFDGYKTNDGIFGNANYAYIATDTNSKEVVIIDLNQISGGKYAEAGYFNAPLNGSGQSVHVITNGANTIGFMTTGSNLHTFDLNSHSGSRNLLGSAALAGTGNKVHAWRDTSSGVLYAFVATSSTSNQLQIFQANATGTTLTLIGQADLAGNGARDVFVNTGGTRAYIAAAVSAGENEFFIVDVSTKTGDRSTLGSTDLEGMNPKGIVVVPGNRAILGGTGGEEYQVLNITSESTPTHCGGLEIDSGVNGVAGVVETDGDAFSYIITGDASSELKIIEGGPGGQFATTGTFTSNYFDPLNTVAYNSFTPNFLEPQSTTLQFQVAVASDVSGSCAASNYLFVGPDGTASTYFDGRGPIPLITSGNYINPGRCMKYRAFFSTTDPTSTPILYDVTVNYSP